MQEKGHDVSCYIVCQMIVVAGLKRRSFVKGLSMSVVEDRNSQFEKIAMTKYSCLEFGFPIISIFSQITRSWSGAPLLSVENACVRTERTVITTGLNVFAKIVTKCMRLRES